jgi:hypothetical protein
MQRAYALGQQLHPASRRRKNIESITWVARLSSIMLQTDEEPHITRGNARNSTVQEVLVFPHGHPAELPEAQPVLLLSTNGDNTREFLKAIQCIHQIF